MPAVAEKQCPACKRPHALYLPDADEPGPVRALFYVCPASGIAVRWVDQGEEWKPAEGQPKGSVTLHPLK